MEAVKASVVREGDKRFIKIYFEDAILIPVSDDNANEVKRAFNRLIAHLRSGYFSLELEEVGEDLFSQVADEYVKQLNREMGEVHKEMVESGLIEG